MGDRSDDSDDPPPTREGDDSERPARATADGSAKRDGPRNGRESLDAPLSGTDAPDRPRPGDPARRGNDDPPRVVAAIGTAGVYLAALSLALTLLGIAGMYAGLQPYANLATTLALAGVTLAMLLGMLFQAHQADFTFGR